MKNSYRCCCDFWFNLSWIIKQIVILFLFSYSYFVYVNIFCLKSLFLISSSRSIQATFLDPKLSVNAIFCYLFGFNLHFLLSVWFYLLVVLKPHKKTFSQFTLDRKFLKQLSLDCQNSTYNNTRTDLGMCTYQNRP